MMDHEQQAERWGRWGSEDEAGAQNLVGTEQVLRALQLPSEGQVVALGQQLGPDTAVPGHRRPVERLMMRDGGDYAAGGQRPGGFQFAEEVLSFAAHSGTHIDAIAHVWTDDLLYNGFSGNTVRSTTGAQRCGAGTLKPLVTRGVLLDVAAQSRTPLEPGQAVTADDLSRTLVAAGVELEAGDVVLIRTGWLGRFGGDANRYFAGEPGIDEGAARLLALADVAMIGTDNYAIEPIPFPKGKVFPVHQFLLRDCGIPLIEGAVLDELAGRDVATFLFLSLPLPLVGGTASPLCPVAVL
jgi:kynurenine formamidase